MNNTWLYQIKNSIKDPLILLKHLKLENNYKLHKGIKAKNLFPFRVPMNFVSKMKMGNIQDPLFLQVMTKYQEFNVSCGYSKDPLNEHKNMIPGLLHKYNNRVLLIVKNSCAINCRYCFRRYFPYKNNQGNVNNWLKSIDYIKKNKNIEEVILSGGDPLMAKDHELDFLITLLEKIPHLNILRIHSRLPSLIPSRITERLCNRLNECRLKVILVTHINHAQEIDKSLCEKMISLKKAKVIILNQSVLLKKINDDADKLKQLSESLLDSKILPYYLHILDKVSGTAHFMVNKRKAKKIINELMKKVSGYLVPKLVIEQPGKKSKTIIK